MSGFAESLANAIASRFRLVLLASICLCALAIWQAGSLRVDTDLRGLLPADHRVVTSLEKIERDFGPLGSINIVVADGDVASRHAFADALAQRLQGNSLLRSVDYRIAPDFFSTRALYYLSDEEMKELTGLVEGWQHAELCAASPTLCVEKPDLEARKRLGDFVRLRKDKLREKIGFQDYYEREGIDALAMFARPTKSASDLAFTVEVATAVREAARATFESEGPWRGSNLRYNIVGPYTARADEAMLVRGDMLKAGVLACLGVVALLLYLFRSWRAIWTLLVPLLAGVAWSLGASQLLLGRLNTMTSLISSMLLGVGIDAGIHLYGTLQQECRVLGTRDALVAVYQRLLGPLLTAAATTVAAFCAMAYSDFPAFREFGIIAAVGVILCAVAMLSVFPAMVCWLGVAPAVPSAHLKLGSRCLRATLGRPWASAVIAVMLAVVSALAAASEPDEMFEWNGRALQSDAARERSESDVFLISKIIGHDVNAGIITLPSFEKASEMARYAKELHAKSNPSRTTVAGIVSLADVLPPPNVDMQARARAIAALDGLFTPRLWARISGEEMPSEPQPQGDDEFVDVDVKLPAAADEDEFVPVDVKMPSDADEDEFVDVDLKKPVDAALVPAQPTTPTPSQAPAKADEASETKPLSPQEVANLRAMLQAKPFGEADLPPDILGRFKGEDGSYAVVIQTAFDTADMRRAVEFIDETEAFSKPFTEQAVVAESTVYAAMLVLMGQESPFILGSTILVILVCVYLQVRSVRQTLLIFVPLLVGLCCLFGVMSLLGLKLTLFNVPMLPAILGIGVDNAVYLGAAIRGVSKPWSRAEIARATGHTGQAIFYATTTTMVGFGAFLVADSGGLRSIGSLASIGIGTAAISAFVFLPPAWLALRNRL